MDSLKKFLFNLRFPEKRCDRTPNIERSGSSVSCSESSSSDCSSDCSSTESFPPTTPVNFPAIPQDVAIRRLNKIKLNSGCTPKNQKIHRKLFPGDAANGNVQIAYLQAGAKHKSRRPTIILIHPFPLTKECWIDVMRLLAPCFHVIAFDQRGFGSSGKPTPTATNYLFTNNAIDLHELMLFVQVQTPILWGAGYAVQVIFEYLKLFNFGTAAPSQLILQSGYTQFLNSGTFVFDLAPSSLANLQHIASTQGLAGVANFLINAGVSDQCQTKCCMKQLNQVKKFAFLMSQTTTLAIAGAQNAAGLVSNSSDPTFLSTIKQPTFLLSGTIDNVMNTRSTFYMALYLGITTNALGQLDPTIQQGPPTVEITQLRGAGDIMQMTRVEELVERVLKFIKKRVVPCSLEVLQEDKVKLKKCDCK